MSGGVDSAVAAARLVDAGLDVVGVTLHLWDYPEEGAGSHGRCCAPEDQHDARRTADALGIAHYAFDRRDGFTREVVTPFVDAYLAGETPSPCVACNRGPKLRELFALADRLGAERVATGHYARVVTEARTGRPWLAAAHDAHKDQSYFLHRLTQAQLARTLLHDPKVLILDEPASDLDPRARIEIRDLLVELRSMGKTIFLSSHILTELADVCTSVAILERGRMVVSGPITEIAERLEAAAAQRQQGYPPQHQPVPYGQPQAPQHLVGGEGAPPQTHRMGADVIHQTMPLGPAAIPKRRAKLKAIAPPEAIRAALAGLPAVLSVEAHPMSTVLVTYSGDDQVLANIVRVLVMANISVVGIEPERSELERIFLEVTKGEVQ